MNNNNTTIIIIRLLAICINALIYCWLPNEQKSHHIIPPKILGDGTQKAGLGSQQKEVAEVVIIILKS